MTGIFKRNTLFILLRDKRRKKSDKKNQTKNAYKTSLLALKLMVKFLSTSWLRKFVKFRDMKKEFMIKLKYKKSSSMFI